MKKFAADIAQNDQENVFYKPSERKSGFPEFRLLSHRPFPKFCAKIVNDWLNHKSYRKIDLETPFPTAEIPHE